MLLIALEAASLARAELPALGPGAVIEGPASHYLGPDDDRPINPVTGGKVEVAAESGTMVQGTNPTAAMRSVPLGSMVRVTNLTNRKSVVVRVNDRGPYKENRVIDLTYAAFRRIESDESRGLLSRVRVEILPPGTRTSWPEQKLSVAQWKLIAARMPSHPTHRPHRATYLTCVGISLPPRAPRARPQMLAKATR